jgi:phosphonate transport system permease protein
MASLAPSRAAALPHDPALAGRVRTFVVAVVVVIGAGWLSEFNPAVLLSPESLQATSQFAASFLPPKLAPDFLALVLQATWQTIAIATVGTTAALLIAVPAALAANRLLSISGIVSAHPCRACTAVRVAVRSVLILLRSIPEVVWALLFVRAVGLGDTAGVLAIALTYGGMLGKVYIEVLESVDPAPTRALLEAGASRLQAFCYGTLPGALPELTSYTIYRWECAIRASVVMGFVGAGGLGMQMELSLKMLAGNEILTMLLVFVALVFAADALSAMLRRWLG